MIVLHSSHPFGQITLLGRFLVVVDMTELPSVHWLADSRCRVAAAAFSRTNIPLSSFWNMAVRGLA
jgi:hypothetical protein